MEASKSRNCVGCGRTISWDANVCPYCGHDYRAAMAPPQPRAEVSTGMRFLLYLVSFFIPIAGFIIGAIYYSNPQPDFKHVGKMCIIIALLPLLLVLLCWFVIGLAWLTFT